MHFCVAPARKPRCRFNEYADANAYICSGKFLFTHVYGEFFFSKGFPLPRKFSFSVFARWTS